MIERSYVILRNVLYYFCLKSVKSVSHEVRETKQSNMVSAFSSCLLTTRRNALKPCKQNVLAVYVEGCSCTPDVFAFVSAPSDGATEVRQCLFCWFSGFQRAYFAILNNTQVKKHVSWQ